MPWKVVPPEANKRSEVLAPIGMKVEVCTSSWGDGMDESGALQHAGKVGNDARAAAWNRGAILAIPDVAGAEFSGAAAERGQAGAAN